MPGMLPVFNSECLKIALKASLALNGELDKENGYGKILIYHLDIRFDRKHYFYSDLPQGYQITQ
jgi:aspartyl-tRNA(Asn)/glutamyl-tRNA(Gln) amidotransferase subunit B